MAQLAAILFFSGLLVALGVVLERLLKANWVEIVAALKGVPPEQLPAYRGPPSAAVKPARSRAAA